MKIKNFLGVLVFTFFIASCGTVSDNIKTISKYNSATELVSKWLPDAGALYENYYKKLSRKNIIKNGIKVSYSHFWMPKNKNPNFLNGFKNYCTNIDGHGEVIGFSDRGKKNLTGKEYMKYRLAKIRTPLIKHTDFLCLTKNNNAGYFYIYVIDRYVVGDDYSTITLLSYDSADKKPSKTIKNIKNIAINSPRKIGISIKHNSVIKEEMDWTTLHKDNFKW